MTPEHKALVAARAEVDAEHAKVNGDDGYNYAAGQEYGLRLALIVLDKHLAAIESLSTQSAQPQAGEAVAWRYEILWDRGSPGDGDWKPHVSLDKPVESPKVRNLCPLYASPQLANPAQVTDAIVERMVQQFLRWKLPEDFNPDGGVSFTKISNVGTSYEYRHEPVGTNLFDYRQAKAMVQHMLEGLPAIGAGRQAVAWRVYDKTDGEWWTTAIESTAKYCASKGDPVEPLYLATNDKDTAMPPYRPELGAAANNPPPEARKGKSDGR